MSARRGQLVGLPPSQSLASLCQRLVLGLVLVGRVLMRLHRPRQQIRALRTACRPIGRLLLLLLLLASALLILGLRLLLVLHSSVLEPNFDLPLSERQMMSNFNATPPS